MSYYRTAAGGFTIKSSLEWGHYRQAVAKFQLMRWVEVTEVKQTHAGELTIRNAVGLEPASESLPGDPIHEIAEAVEICRCAGSALFGTVFVVGEDGPLDTWRYGMDDTGHLIADQAILVWPNGRRAYQETPQDGGGAKYLVLGNEGPVAWDVLLPDDRILRSRPWAR